jgi:hypothetical protein
LLAELQAFLPYIQTLQLPGKNAITHYSQTIFEKKEGVTVGRRSNTPETNNSASASTIWCTIGVGSKLDPIYSGNRMRESCTYGSVRGCEVTRIPTSLSRARYRE